MKNLLALSLIMLNFITAHSQTCNFTYENDLGTNNFTFIANSNFSPNDYHFLWTFGDGTSSTQAFPHHTYNMSLPLVACYSIYDSNNVMICSACDTIRNLGPDPCDFYLNICQGQVCATYNATYVPGLSADWDFGDGTTGSGLSTTHMYPTTGTFTICLSRTDSTSGLTVCNSCQTVFVPNLNQCSFTTYHNPLTPLTFDFVANVPPNTIVSWNFGDQSGVHHGTYISHTYATLDSFPVTMTSNSGCQPSWGWVCTGTPPPLTANCTFSYTQNSTPKSYSFQSPPTSGLWSWVVWDFGDNTVDTGNYVMHNYAAPGNYIVCIQKVDTFSNVLCSSCMNVIVSTAVNCNFNATTSPGSLAAIFQANGALSGSGYAINWDYGDNTTDTGIISTHTYSNAGTYMVCLTITQGGVSVCSSCHFVTVTSTATSCVISYLPNQLQPNNMYFNLTTLGGGTVTWDFGDNTVGMGSSINHIYLNPGIYTVCAMERDSNQNVLCQNCVNINVGGVLVNCNALFISTSLNLTGYFIDQSNTSPNNTVYNWSFGDGSHSNVRFPQHIYPAPGTYTVCLSITSGNCTDQFCSPIIVDTTSSPAGPCQAFFTKVQLAPFQVSIVNLSGGSNLSYLWDFGDGTTDTNPFPSHYYSATGSYNLCLTVADNNGCTSTFCDTLNVDTLGNIFRGMSGFMVNVVSADQLTGMNEVLAVKSSFHVYPNPSTSDLHISSEDKMQSYRVLSIQGAEVLSGNLSATENIVDLQKISTGSYLLEVVFTDGSRSYKTVVKN